MGSETKFFWETVDQDGAGISGLEKLSDTLLTSAGLENCNPVHSPGVRSETSVLDEEPLLGPPEHKHYRTIVGNLMFLVAERPDIEFCVKECAGGVGNPSRAKRICRYLMGTREWTLKLELWKDVDGC